MHDFVRAPHRRWQRMLCMALLCATTAQADGLAVLGAEQPLQLISSKVQAVTHWILRMDDHQGLPFVVVDKVQAHAYVYNPMGELLGSAPVLLGLSKGDDGLEGIGERALSTIAPHERKTPAGRFFAHLDVNIQGQALLWVDYEQAISLHPVRKGNTHERRLERLATPSAHDNRITYGCINVAPNFWYSVVVPAFTETWGVVYVLPDTHSLNVVFAMDSDR